MAADKIMRGDVMEFATNMKKLINNKENSDIKFIIGSNRKAIYAHRCILSARCALFKAMFADQAQKNGTADKETPLILSDMNPDIFLAMLEFLYTNCVTLTSKISIEVLATALEFGLDDLRRLCVDFLVENLSVQNACDCLQAAVAYQQEELKDRTMKYIEEHTESVLKTKGFQELSDDALAELLRSDLIKIDEAELIKYVKEWATVNAVVTGKPVSETAHLVVQHIRLPILSPEELEKLERENKKDSLIPVDMFSSSWKFHALGQPDPNNPGTKKRAGTTSRAHHKNLQG